MILDLIVLLFVGYVMLMGYRRGWWLNCLRYDDDGCLVDCT